VNEYAFELFFTQVFAKALQDELTMYALVMINVVEESIIEHQVKAMNNVMSCITNVRGLPRAGQIGVSFN